MAVIHVIWQTLKNGFNWYVENLPSVFITVTILVLVVMISIASLAPISWWGDYGQPGISVMDQIGIGLGLMLAALFFSGLIGTLSRREPPEWTTFP